MRNFNDGYKKQKLEYILSKTITTGSGCMEWQGHIHAITKYGYLCYLGKKQGVHRVVWMILKGEIPKNKCVLHSCDNRPCINPDHLFLGTKKDNTEDMMNKNRQNNYHKLKNKIELISKIKKGVLYKQLAKEFGISIGHVSRIAIKNGIKRMYIGVTNEIF
jgi:hypothetical protein